MTDEHTQMTDRSTLHSAHSEFASAVSTLDDDMYGLPSPCDSWTVGNVIDHLAGGAVMTAALLAGNSSGNASIIREAWTRGPSTQRRLWVALALERAAFEVAEPSEHVDHPVLPMTVTNLLGQRIFECAVHTWDIRRAIGDPTPLDPALARRAWQMAAPLAPFARRLGVFGAGPSGRVPADADDEARLVDLAGRRVHVPPVSPSRTVAS